MNKLLLSLAILASISLVALAGDAVKPQKAMVDFRAVPMEKAQLLQDGKGKMYCPVCGMTLPAFHKTNHAATVDGKTHQYCSIHCMVEEAVTNGKEVAEPQVIDNDTQKFIKASDAFYVVGSKKPATMSMVSKYAFGQKESAEKFAKEFGGKIMNYATLEKVVKDNLQKENAGIAKKQAKMVKMGEKVYQKMCKPTDIRFTNAAEAKTYLKEKQLCGKLEGKPFQQVALYLSGKAN